MTEITALLHAVSGTEVCMRSLTSAPWLSLLLELSHRGSLPVQRRVSRLLRVLVPLCSPASFQVRAWRPVLRACRVGRV